IDYLLKPVDPTELKSAVEKVKEGLKNRGNTSQVYEQFLTQMKNAGNPFTKLCIPTREGILFVEIQRIIRCESDANYTWFYLEGGQKILASKTLKEYEQLLSEHLFYRVHKSHLINLHHLDRYVRGEGGSVFMDNGDEVEVSRRTKESFLQKLKELQ
ncbi:MAG: LytTR family DNA-binding domain-containing protein, partial [Bacteroidota bacterium]|nr:LytTR family DNA-binding domain-containing protein [Bacteroidota bacterium]MDX5430613.1 LytTR family DNA-binding domain-containing protein [Bacteroidota bacterium]MDX5469365.1 LytTR family DNA-binding domain-containing protein [Bacteroidota bacterium]